MLRIVSRPKEDINWLKVDTFRLNLDHPRSVPIAHEFSLLIRKKACAFIAF